MSILQIFQKIKKRQNWLLEAAVILAIAILSFLFSLQASNDIWKTGSTDTDSSVFKYVARVILAGGMPYLDAFDHKGPLTYLINVLGIRIAEWRGIWLLEWVGLFVTFYFIYKTVRIYTGRGLSLLLLLISTCPLFSYFQGGNLTEEYAMPFIAVSLYIYADYFINTHINVFRLAACGFSFGAVLLLRPNMCSVWIVMCLGVLVQCIWTKNVRKLWPFLGGFMTGALIAVVPIVLWLAVHGAFGAFIEDYIVFNMHYSSSEIVNRVSSFIQFGKNWLTLFAMCGLSYVCFRKRRYFDIVYLLYLLVTLLFICISGKSYSHYGMILVPALGYPFARIADVLREGAPTPVIADFFVIYVLVTFAASGWLGAVQNAVTEYSVKGESHFKTNEAEVTNLVVKHSTEEDKILVLGNWDIIYNLSHRFAASRYSYQAPPLNIDSARAEEFYQEIQANRPKVIVLPQNSFAYDWILQYVEKNNYDEAGKTKDQTVTVYSRSE